MLEHTNLKMHSFLQQVIIDRLKKDVQRQKDILVNERLEKLGLSGISFTREEGESESYWHEENGIETHIITFMGFNFETKFVGEYNESFSFEMETKYF